MNDPRDCFLPHVASVRDKNLGSEGNISPFLIRKRKECERNALSGKKKNEIRNSSFPPLEFLGEFGISIQTCLSIPFHYCVPRKDIVRFPKKSNPFIHTQKKQDELIIS